MELNRGVNRQVRVLMVCNHHVVGCARYMRDAYKRVGADIRTVGPAFGREIWNVQMSADRVWEPDGSIETNWPDWFPDLVVHCKEPPFQFNPRYRGVPQVVHTVDNHVINFRQEGIDHYFLAAKQGPAMPVERAEDTWLPCAYDPHFFTPSPIPWRDRKFDVAMIGVMYPHRAELANAIRAAGFNVNAGTGPVYEEFRDIYHNARISLCPSLRGGVGQRIYETAAMKCLLLCDPCPEFAELKIDGIALFESVEDAVEMVKYLLANPEIAGRMIERSYEWARPHTWDARARSILEWRESWEENKREPAAKKL